MPGKLGLSDTEYLIMSYIWEENKELLCKDIFQHFSKMGYTWAMQTIKSFLNNLIRKGALTFKWQGHKKLYFASMPKETFASLWIEEVLEQNFDNMNDFCLSFNKLSGELTDSQKKELESIWNE